MTDTPNILDPLLPGIDRDRLFGGSLYSKPGENTLSEISSNDMNKE